MQKSVISIGDRIELVQTKSALRSKKSDAHYTSQLLEYDGIRTIKILMPISEGRVVPLEVNDEYELCFFTAKGMYRCTATILRRYREKKIFVSVFIESSFISVEIIPFDFLKFRF